MTVAMTVPTIQRISRVSRLPSRVSRLPTSQRTSARPARNWSGRDVVTVLEAVVGSPWRCLVAGDAAGGELLGDGEHVEH